MHQKEIMINEDYVEYSLKQLDVWVNDALHCGATPTQVYDCIVNAVQENIIYHKVELDKHTEFMSLLKGHRPVDFGDIPSKWTLPVEIDDASGEYFLTLPDDLLNSLDWKEGDELEWIDKENGTFELRKI